MTTRMIPALAFALGPLCILCGMADAQPMPAFPIPQRPQPAPAPQQRPPTPALMKAEPLAEAPGDDEFQRLQTRRYNAWLDATKVAHERFSPGGTGIEQLYDVADRLRRAGLEVHSQPDDRIAFLEQYRELAGFHSWLAKARVAGGEGTTAQALRAQYWLLGAELELLRAQGPATTDAARDRLAGLLNERRDVAAQEMKVLEAHIDGAVAPFDVIVEPSARLMQAELELASSREERTRAVKRHLEFAQQFESIVASRWHGGGEADAIDDALARYQRLEVEIRLSREQEETPKQDDVLRRLLQQQRDALAKEADVRKQRSREGVERDPTTFAALERLLHVELELADGWQDRIAALDRYLRQTTTMETLVEAQFKGGGADRFEHERAQAFRLDAEIRLMRQERQLDDGALRTRALDQIAKLSEYARYTAAFPKQMDKIRSQLAAEASKLEASDLAPEQYAAALEQYRGRHRQFYADHYEQRAAMDRFRLLATSAERFLRDSEARLREVNTYERLAKAVANSQGWIRWYDEKWSGRTALPPYIRGR